LCLLSFPLAKELSVFSKQQSFGFVDLLHFMYIFNVVFLSIYSVMSFFQFILLCYRILKMILAGSVAHACNPSPQEAEAGGS
jgi:hypothetical protein